MKKLLPLLLACSCLASPFAFAAPEPAAKVSRHPNLDPAAIALLDKSAKAYAALRGLSMKFDIYDQSGRYEVSFHGTFAYSKPYSSKFEFHDGTRLVQSITDKETIYRRPNRKIPLLDNPPIRSSLLYLPSNVYIPFAFLIEGHNPLTVDSPLFDQSGMTWTSAKLLSKNAVGLKVRFKDGQPPMELRLFFGEKDRLLRRVETVSTLKGTRLINNTSFSQVVINPKFAPDTFKFVPLAGGLEQEDFPVYDPRIKIGAAPIPLHGVDLKKYRGKVLLLEFRGAWSAPFTGEIDNTKSVYRKYHPKGLDIVGIAEFGTKAQFQKAVKAAKTPWSQIFDSEHYNQDDEYLDSNTTNYGLMTSNLKPSFSILIGKNGKIAAINPRGKWLGREVEKALAAKP